MRNRNIRIQLWLNKKEADRLDKSVKKSGLSREAYLRHLINGWTIVKKVDKGTEKIKSNSRNGQVIKGY